MPRFKCAKSCFMVIETDLNKISFMPNRNYDTGSKSSGARSKHEARRVHFAFCRAAAPLQAHFQIGRDESRRVTPGDAERPAKPFLNATETALLTAPLLHSPARAAARSRREIPSLAPKPRRSLLGSRAAISTS
jgi:hypothetical protein